jgi:hypothetical protein
MKPEYEKQLEVEIDRQLKALPELAAPPGLTARVRLAIEREAELVWYRQPWQMWPSALRAGSLALLLALFAGLCLVGVWLGHSEWLVGWGQRVNPVLSDVGAVGNALSTIGSAGVLAVKQIGTGLLLAAAVALVIGYGMCLGLGTVCVRLALTRR